MKKINLFIVFIEYLLITYIWQRYLSLADGIEALLMVGALTAVFKYCKFECLSTLYMPWLEPIGEYIVFSILFLGIGISAFVFHLFPCSLLLYVSFIVFTTTAYYLLKDAVTD